MIVKTPRLQRPVLPCNRLMNTDAGEPPNRGFDSNFNIILFIVRQCSTYVDRERIYKYVSIKLKNYEYIILLEAIHVGDRRKEFSFHSQNITCTTLNLYKYYNTRFASDQSCCSIFNVSSASFFSLYNFLPPPLFFWQLQKITNMCIVRINKE